MAQKIRRVVKSAAFLATVLCAACSAPERSRTLGDANVSGRTVALQVCATCHGATGSSISPAFPNLAGQQANYLVIQLKSFRSHRRSDPKGHEYMWGMSSPLTDEQITALGDYYAAQQPAPKKRVASSRSAEGQAIYEKGVAATGVVACIACHGARAEGNAQFPRLAGQHEDYLVKQLQIFGSTNARPDGVAMQGIAHALTAQNMKDVAEYLQSL
jgi:cytochrome c553